jgi:hypothetical protein
VNHEPFHVADDQQRRILQSFAITEQLIVGSIEILVLAFVFPAKEPALPNIRKTLAAAVLRGAFFEREFFAEGIGERRLWMIKDFAQIKKVLL